MKELILEIEQLDRINDAIDVLESLDEFKDIQLYRKDSPSFYQIYKDIHGVRMLLILKHSSITKKAIYEVEQLVTNTREYFLVENIELLKELKTVLEHIVYRDPSGHNDYYDRKDYSFDSFCKVLNSFQEKINELVGGCGMTSILYNPYPDNERFEVRIFGNKYGEHIDMTVSEFRELVNMFEKQYSQHKDFMNGPYERHILVEERKIKLLEEIKEMLEKL